MNFSTKEKQTHRIQTEGQQDNWGDVNQEFRTNAYTVLYKKQINNKNLLYSTGKYLQYLIIIYNEKNLKMNMYIFTCMCTAEPPCCIPETNTIL